MWERGWRKENSPRQEKILQLLRRIKKKSESNLVTEERKRKRRELQLCVITLM